MNISVVHSGEPILVYGTRMPINIKSTTNRPGKQIMFRAAGGMAEHREHVSVGRVLQATAISTENRRRHRTQSSLEIVRQIFRTGSV